MYNNIGINKHKYINHLSKSIKKTKPSNKGYYAYTYNFDDEEDEYYNTMRQKYEQFYRGFLDENSFKAYDKVKSDISSKNDNNKCCLDKISDCIEDKCDFLQDSYYSIKESMFNKYDDIKDMSCNYCDDSCYEEDDTYYDEHDTCCDEYVDDFYDADDTCCDKMIIAKKVAAISLGIVAGVGLVGCLLNKRR